jgi:hypothetical protein
MIRFELCVASPRAIASILHGHLQLTTDKQVYALPFGADFEAEICRFYQGIASLVEPNAHAEGIIQNESGEIKKYHSWIIERGSGEEMSLRVYRLIPQTNQKEPVFEYKAPWVNFVVDFSNIAETNYENGLWDTLTAWNTLLKRTDKKAIAVSKILYSAQDVLFNLFKKVTYPVEISELLKGKYIEAWQNIVLRILHLKYKTVEQTVIPTTKTLKINWRLAGMPFPVCAISIEWEYFDEVILKGENILLLRKKSPVLVIPKHIFALSSRVEYAHQYAYHFGIYLYDDWFHRTQV